MRGMGTPLCSLFHVTLMFGCLGEVQNCLRMGAQAAVRKAAPFLKDVWASLRALLTLLQSGCPTPMSG